MCSPSRTSSSVFESPDLRHQSQCHDLGVGFFSLHGSSRHKHGIFSVLIRCMATTTDRNCQFQVYALQPVWSWFSGWNAISIGNPRSFRMSVALMNQGSNVTDILPRSTGVSISAHGIIMIDAETMTSHHSRPGLSHSSRRNCIIYHLVQAGISQKVGGHRTVVFIYTSP